jgi:hypothetical protein
MIDYGEILQKTREGEFKWIVEVYEAEKTKHMPRFARPLSEFTLTEQLGNFRNEFGKIAEFLHWQNHPGYVDGRGFPHGLFMEEDCKIDGRRYDPMKIFSEFYSRYVDSTIPTARLGKFVIKLDEKINEFNKVMPLTKVIPIKRDFVATKFVEMAGLVLICENSIESAAADIEFEIKMIYDYKVGKIMTTNPHYHNNIPLDKRHLFGL